MDLVQMSFTNPILFFDGVCNLCNASVRFILERDKSGFFRFSPLQTELLMEAFPEFVSVADNFDSIVLLENGKIYTHSTAALRIAKKLRFPYSLLYVFAIVPRPMRDWLYGVISRNRYKWFGRQAACMLPTAENKSKFL